MYAVKSEYGFAYGSIFILLLVCSETVGEDRRRIRRETDGSVYCDFDEARNDHSASDLLRCIDELAVDLVVGGESASATNGERNGSTGRQISFVDVLSNIFNTPATSHQSGSLPAYSTSGNQQLNYPSGTAALSAGFQLNFLAQALSTISRHDDYKCVARILCEMASGKLPGRSLGEQGSFQFLGRNVFTDWLAKIDVGGTSPLLNFGTAMILGYSNRGSSEPCYQAFPKCPRDMHGLVHYLNNYNGGFFRLFNRIRGGKYRNGIVVGKKRVDDYSKIDAKERIVGGDSRKYIPIESAGPQEAPIRNTVQFPAMSYQEYLRKKGFPRYDKVSSGAMLERDPWNSVENDAAKSEWNIWRKDKIAFFAEGNRDRGLSRVRFPSDFPLTRRRNSAC